MCGKGAVCGVWTATFLGVPAVVEPSAELGRSTRTVATSLPGKLLRNPRGTASTWQSRRSSAERIELRGIRRTLDSRFRSDPPQHRAAHGHLERVLQFKPRGGHRARHRRVLRGRQEDQHLRFRWVEETTALGAPPEQDEATRRSVAKKQLGVLRRSCLPTAHCGLPPTQRNDGRRVARHGRRLRGIANVVEEVRYHRYHPVKPREGSTRYTAHLPRTPKVEQYGLRPTCKKGS